MKKKKTSTLIRGIRKNKNPKRERERERENSQFCGGGEYGLNEENNINFIKNEMERRRVKIYE